MRRRLAILSLLVLAGLSVWILWPKGGAPSATAESVRGDGSIESDRAAGAKPRLLNALLNAPLPERKGSLSIRGRVTGKAGPVPGAIVTATSGVGDEVLSTMKCACDNSCGEPLLSCGCGESARQLLELVADRRGEAPPIARTTSAADGSFVIDGLDQGSFAIWAEKSAGGIGLLKSVEAGSTGVEIPISDGMIVDGDAKGDDKKPIAGAIVTAIYAEHSRFFDAVSDAQGKFRIGPVPSGTYAVVGVRRPFLPDRARVSPGSTTVHLDFESPRRIAGRLLREGTPVEGAALQLTGNHRIRKTSSGAGGTFSFTDLSTGEYSLRASQGTVAAIRQIRVRKGEDQLDLTLNLGAAAELSGFVRDRLGTPIRDARVRLSTTYSSNSVQTTTAADGSFHTPPLEPGEYSIVASAAGRRASEQLKRTIVPGAAFSVEIVLDTSAACTGTVFSPDGKPLEGAVVTAVRQEQSAVTKADGSFSVGSLAPGSDRLRVAHERYQPLEEEVQVPREGLRFVLREGIELGGVVVEEGGGSVMGATVRLEQKADRDQPMKSTFSDAEGKFVLRGVPAGAYQLRASTSERERSSREATLEIDAAASRNQPLVLRFPKGLSIAGTVTDDRGAPLAGARVMAFGTPGKKGRRGEFQRGTATSSETGAFHIDHLQEGRLEIYANMPGYQSSRDVEHFAQAGDSSVRVVLRRAAHVKGRVLRPDGMPASEFEIGGTSISDADGRFDIPNPGETLVVRASGIGTAQRQLPPEIKDDLDLGNVQLVAPRSISGHVIDEATGAPLAGVAFSISNSGDSEKSAVSFGLSHTDRPLAFSNAAGEFTVADFPESVTLTASRQGYLPWSSSQISQENLVIALKSGGRIAGSVRSKSGSPLKGIAVFAVQADRQANAGRAETGADGAFEIGGLAPGSYSVMVASRLPFSPITATVADGTPARADFVERSGGASLILTWDEEKEEQPMWPILLPGDVAAPAGEGEFKSRIPLVPTSQESEESNYEALPLGRYTLFILQRGEGDTRFDRRVIDVSAEGEQRVTVRVAATLPFTMKDN